MFKMRVQNPNKPKAVLKEKANINYIATRPGVVLNEGCEHGLFGRIEKKQQQETLNLKEAKGLIGERRKEKKVYTKNGDKCNNIIKNHRSFW